MDAAQLEKVRDRSILLFGNASMLTVVLELDREGPGTAKQIESRTGISYTPVRDVLKRLEQARLVTSSRDPAGKRAPLHYNKPILNTRQWDALVRLAAIAEAEELGFEYVVDEPLANTPELAPG